MTETATAAPPPAPPSAAAPRYPWLRTGLAVVAAIEALDGLASWPSLFSDYGDSEALTLWAQRLTQGQIALAPLIAAAAFVLAIAGRLRDAIVAMAVLILLVWVTDLPSIGLHGLELSMDYGGVTVLLQRFVYPLIAVAAIVLARRNERPGLAVLLVSLPTIINWIGVAIFTVSIMMNGF